MTRTTDHDFDLNIEKVLDGWTVSHAIRELIANALDEQALSGTDQVEIMRAGEGIWRIRDFGRGLRHTHLTQNENAEKRDRESEVIGRFGVGLKDAFAVLDRLGVGVRIRSAHGEISLVNRAKTGFSDVTTLHARVGRSPEPTMAGTEVTITGLKDAAVEEAKNFFLRFSNEEVLEITEFGQILRRTASPPARIYVNGLVVSEEPDFAFSYNVTALTQAMRKALNRERTNVGRTAYSGRVKAMLVSAKSPAVAEVLAKDLKNLAAGRSHEEVRIWSDVGVLACQILNATRRYVFVTDEQLVADKEMVDRAIEDGREIITVPRTIAAKLRTVTDVAGNPLQSLGQFGNEWSASVEYQFVSERDLTPAERAVYQLWQRIADLAGGLPREFKELKISATMRPSVIEGMKPAGFWEPATGQVIVHRPALKSMERFGGTLLHELTHARTGYDDVSRDFESALTDLIGRLVHRALSRESGRGHARARAVKETRREGTRRRAK